MPQGRRPAGPALHPLASHALIERRRFISSVLAAAAAGVVAGCGASDRQTAPATAPTSSTSTSSAPPSTSSTTSTTIPTTTNPPATSPPTTSPPTTVAYDPDLPYWVQGNFAPVPDEIDAVALTVEGALPPELDGLYVRNGSNPFDGAGAHWFLGDGMVHAVRLRGGRAEWYRNRWIETPLLSRGTILGGGDTGPPGGANNSSNTSAVFLADRLLSLQEVGFPYELSPDDLSTIGPFDFGGELTTAMTAHPKVDPATGQLHFFGYGFVPPFLTYHVASPDGRLLRSETVDVPGPTMIHDFAITDRDVVFWDLPVVFSMELALAREMPFTWDPSYGARIGTFPLGGSAAAARWVEIEPCYVFHGTNAWREGDDIVLDVSRMPTMFAPGGDAGPNALNRWRMTGVGEPGASGPIGFGAEVVADRSLDLPTIDPRRLGRPHRHAWYASTRDALGGFDFGGVVHVDAVTGRLDAWDPGPHESAGESLFVPGGPGEGEGWVLTFGYDATTDSSDLLVFDATDCAAGPIARVRLPRRVPYGFHACWVPGERLGA